MKRLLPLALLPVAGVLIVLFGLLSGGRDLRVRLVGEHAPSRVAGMLVIRADGRTDLVDGAATTLRLRAADGGRFEFEARDYRLVSGRHFPAASESAREFTPAELAAETGAETITPELRRVLQDAVTGDAAEIRWALRREERRRDDPRRIVTLEKSERVSGYFNLPSPPARVRAEAGGVAPADPRHAGATRSEARVTALFDRGDREALEANRGESLRSYVYENPGRPGEPARKGFYLQSEPYPTVFRPVYAYEIEGRAYAGVSTVGRQGGPTLALRLFRPALVYYDAREPERAVLFADPGRPDGKVLDWFSRVCEGVFAQWGASAMIVIAGLCVVAAGLLTASLALRPTKNLR